MAPGVLLDAAAERGVRSLDAGHLVTAADLEACCRRQRVEVKPGDVVLIRTGNALFWDDPERFLAGPGMASNASEWLAAKGVLAVGADNMAWDVIGLRDPIRLPTPRSPHSAGSPRHLHHREPAAGGAGRGRAFPLHLHLHAPEVHRRHGFAGAPDRGGQCLGQGDAMPDEVVGRRPERRVDGESGGGR